MAVRVKIDPVERVTEAAIRADLSRPDQQRAAAQFARDGIADADAINRRILGRVPPRTITVDGRQGAPLETVDPDGGTIIVEYELVGDVLRWIAQTLIARSPVVSGEYRRGHTLFVDGQEIPLDREIPVADEYTFVNFVPYARKIEIGKTKAGRDFVIQVPNRIYERTAKDAKSKFGNIASIEMTYRGVISGTMYAKSGPRRRIGAKAGRESRRPGAAQNKSGVRYPAIIVRLRAA